MTVLNYHADIELQKEPITLLDYVGGIIPIYVGKAAPNSSTSGSCWQILKLVYDVNGNVTSIKMAGGTSSATSVWDNRATLTYA
jgi:hypothetical protein